MRRYLPALRAHVLLKYQVTEEKAEDLLQEFIFRQVLQGALIAKADRSRGLFRTFLLNALDNFVFNELRRERAKKRAPENGTVALDDLEERDRGITASQAVAVFDLEWSRAVMIEALRRVEAECRESGRESLWEVLKGRLIDPLLDDAQPLAYDELVRRFGFESPTQVYAGVQCADYGQTDVCPHAAIRHRGVRTGRAGDRYRDRGVEGGFRPRGQEPGALE